MSGSPPRRSLWPDLDPLTDRHLHIYQVSGSPYPSPLEGEPAAFGVGSSQIRLVDVFGGRRPVLLNHDFLTSRGEYPLKLLVTLILDSQVASRLHDYRIGRDVREPGRRRATEDFLVFASRRLVDYNPTFYLLESYSKSTSHNFIDWVTPVLTSILHLHSMDEAHFVKTREIRLNPDAVDHYCARYGARTLDECGEAWVDRMLQDPQSRDATRMIRATYVSLLKMTLIHKRGRQPVSAKMEELDQFLTAELGIFMGHESHLAVYYFADRVRRLLPVQRGTSFENARACLMRTAWDILLLRMPEILLNPDELPLMSLPFICSAEQELAEFGAFFTIESIGIRTDDRSIIGPLLSMDLSLLQEKLGREPVQALIDASHRRFAHRRNSRPGIERASGAHLERIEADLEAQLVEFLSGRENYQSAHS
jgi:hypothetical protein